MILCQWKIPRVIHVNKGLAVVMHRSKKGSMQNSKKGWWPHHLFISITTILVTQCLHFLLLNTPILAWLILHTHSRLSDCISSSFLLHSSASWWSSSSKSPSIGNSSVSGRLDAGTGLPELPEDLRWPLDVEVIPAASDTIPLPAALCSLTADMAIVL